MIPALPDPTPAPPGPTCQWTEFVGRRRQRHVCGSADRVRPVQTGDDPEFVEDLCFDHALPLTYEKTFDEALEDDLLEAVGGDSPKAEEIRRLRDEARLLRMQYAQDRRYTRLLQEEEQLRQEADRLEEELLLESAGGDTHGIS